jgi:hypothetical protein
VAEYSFTSLIAVKKTATGREGNGTEGKGGRGRAWMMMPFMSKGKRRD